MNKRNYCFTVNCPANQITQNGTCEDCPNAGEVPNNDRLTCIACQSNEYTDGGTCKTCQTGEVPNAERLGCDQCPKSQIAKNGICEDCPYAGGICQTCTKKLQINPKYCSPLHTGTGVTCRYEFFKYHSKGGNTHPIYIIGNSSKLIIKQPINPKNCSPKHTGAICRYEFFKYFKGKINKVWVCQSSL